MDEQHAAQVGQVAHEHQALLLAPRRIREPHLEYQMHLLAITLAVGDLGASGLGRQSFIAFVAQSATYVLGFGIPLALMRQIGESVGAGEAISSALPDVTSRLAEPLLTLERILVRFSQLVMDQKWIQEIEINPLLASSDEIIALDARAVLHDCWVALFAGSDNLCFLPISQERTFAWFDGHARGAHSLHVLPGYGHLDVFMGRRAAADVFPLIRAELGQAS